MNDSKALQYRRLLASSPCLHATRYIICNTGLYSLVKTLIAIVYNSQFNKDSNLLATIYMLKRVGEVHNLRVGEAQNEEGG